MNASSLTGLILLAAASTALAELPHIGYAYPAGGRQGSVFEITVGGQYLKGAERVIVSGAGVRAELLDYAVRYEQRELGRLYRRREDLQATINQRKEKGEAFAKEQQQLEEVEYRLSVAELPDGIEVANKQQALRSYARQTKEQFNPQIAERIRLRITIDGDADAGERTLRVTTPEGLSNPLFFEVGTLSEVLEEEPNDDHMGPKLQTVAMPAVINGQIRPGDIDHFRFRAEAGDSIVVNVAARRIIPYLADAVPGWFQAVAVLYDDNGDEVAYDDDWRFNPDPVLLLEVPESGIYTLAIHDSIYRGREDFVYRIAIGELPFITAIFPLGGRQGEEVDIRLSGRNLPLTNIRGTLPGNDGSVRELSVQQEGYRSNRMPFAIDTLPEMTETEPNNTADTAQDAALPIIVNGRIRQPGDRDVYCFQGEKGATVSIIISARRLGSPLDSIISLSGPGLDSPVRNDDYMQKDSTHLHLGAGLITHHADSYLIQELPESGTYFVEVADTQGKGGEAHAYRLRIAPAAPDFALTLEPSGAQIAPGGTAVFTLRALRSEGFEGPIEVTATNLPDGFIVGRAEIAGGSDTARITLTAPDQADAGTISPAIVGTARINGIAVTRAAEPVDDQMQAFLYRHLVPARELVLSASSEPVPLAFALTGQPGREIRLPLGEEVRIPFKGTIRSEKRGTNVSIDNPPPGLTVVKGWIGRPKEADLSETDAVGSVVLKAEAPLEPGAVLQLIPVGIFRQGGDESRYPAPSITVRVTAPKE